MNRTCYILLFLCLFSFTNKAFSKPPNFIESQQLKEIVELAHKGYIEAQYIIGRAILLHETDFSDKELAMQWLDNAVQQDPRYAFQIALAYGKNLPEAKQWYLKAANLGIHQAFLSLGYLYWGDQKSDVDNLKAMKHFEKALSHNQTEANASLGYMYMKGLGVKQDLVKAETLLRKAIAFNDPSGFYYMGKLEQFHKTKSDIKSAIQHYINAAKSGHPTAGIQIVRTYIKTPAQTQITQEEALFWAFIVKRWGARIKPDTYLFLTEGLTSDTINQLKMKAEALYKSFSQ